MWCLSWVILNLCLCNCYFAKELSHLNATLSKRDQKWSTQDGAVEELVSISERPNSFANGGKYIYPAEAGEGIWIYQVELGFLASWAKHAEFKGRVESSLTVLAPGRTRKPVSGHSMCVADKAMGLKFGVAKKAKLVPVAFEAFDSISFTAALKLIKDDLTDNHPERKEKSVIIASVSAPAYLMSLDNKDDIRRLMNDLFNMGVPIVMAAGNIQDTFDSDQVDGFPQVLEDDDFPLLNVGNADKYGNIACDSKRGPKVSVYLDGTAATCVVFKDMERNYVPQPGTSYAAPLLAGMIAVFMSQTQGEFYDSTHQYAGTRMFVNSVRHFIKTKASIFRMGDARMGWNMAP